MKTSIELIEKERVRQINKEGWTADHDDSHDDGELAVAAACYALPPEVRDQSVFNKSVRQLLWPWDERDWNPTAGDRRGRIKELVKAGALIAAEIDRLQRLRK